MARLVQVECSAASPSVDGADGNVLAEQHQETLDLPPFAKSNCVAELAIMAATRRCFIQRRDPKLLEEEIRLLDTLPIGDIE